MHKWIMSILFSFASLFAIVLIFLLILNTEPNTQKNESNNEPPSVKLDVEAATAMYQAKCLNCHGIDLEGGVGPSLTTVGSKLTEKMIYQRISKGKGATMPAFKGKLTPEEISNLSQWLAEKKE